MCVYRPLRYASKTACLRPHQRARVASKLALLALVRVSVRMRMFAALCCLVPLFACSVWLGGALFCLIRRSLTCDESEFILLKLRVRTFVVCTGICKNCRGCLGLRTCMHVYICVCICA